MHNIRKTALLAASCAALALLSAPAEAQSRYGQTPVAAPQQAPNGVLVDRYGRPLQIGPKKYKNVWHRMRGQKHISHQTRPPTGMFQQWVDYEPQYSLVPGDQVEVSVASAPELSRTLTVGPDGRLVMPMAKPIMAAGRTFQQVQALLMQELSTQLRDPRLTVIPRAYAPEQIYVGGQVGQPGTYTIPGRIGALEGILMAGGLRPTAKSREIAILRRAPNGGMMMRSVNIRGGMLNIREYNDNIQLRRGDIIYVPQNTLGEVGTFMDGFRRALPVDFNLSYQFGSNAGGTTVVSP
jgi:protein involved in polysaccharide export with SLBB domain